MNNFLFENKTKVYFGKGGVKEYLGCLLKHYGDTVMLAYGGGSIKRNGVYDEIVGILNAEGKRIVEFSGIMPNPTYAKVQEGAKLARLDTDYIDLLLIHQPAGDYITGYRLMEKAYKEGKVRAIGLSNFNAEQIKEILSIQ
mgnify:CR=1 FL=1